MKKRSYFLSILIILSLTASGCNDKETKTEDKSLGKVVEGAYPVQYSLNGENCPDSFIHASKSTDISAIITMYQQPVSRTSVVNPIYIVFKVGISLNGQDGAVEFSGTAEGTTVYVGETKYEDAKVEIEGSFDYVYGLTSEITGPSHWIEYTATIRPAVDPGATETPEPIVIEVRDARYPRE